MRLPRLLALWALLLLVACGGQAPSTDVMAPPPGAAAMVQAPIVYGLISVGQSNGLGVDKIDPPAGLPDPSIPFWRNDYYANDGTHAFGPLDVAPRGATFSHEIRMAQRFKEAGLTVAVIKLCQGATFINRWIPTAKAPSAGTKLYAEVAEAAAALRARYPGAEVRFIWVWDQGEAEARYADRPTVEKWPDDFFAIQAGLEAALGQTLHPFVMRTCSTITGKTFPGLLEGLQESVTTADHVIDTNDSEFMPDGVRAVPSGRELELFRPTRIGEPPTPSSRRTKVMVEDVRITKGEGPSDRPVEKWPDDFAIQAGLEALGQTLHPS